MPVCGNNTNKMTRQLRILLKGWDLLVQIQKEQGSARQANVSLLYVNNACLIFQYLTLFDDMRFRGDR